MFFASAHPGNFACAAPSASRSLFAWTVCALACGSMTGAGADRRSDGAGGAEARGRPARCGSPGSMRRRRSWRSTGSPRLGPIVACKIALLAPRPDRWGRWLADLDGARRRFADRRSAERRRRARKTRIRDARLRGRAARGSRRRARARRRLGLWATPDAVLAAGDARSAGRSRTAASSSSRAWCAGLAWGARASILISAARDGFTVVAPRKAEAGVSAPRHEACRRWRDTSFACAAFWTIDSGRESSLPIP